MKERFQNMQGVSRGSEGEVYKATDVATGVKDLLFCVIFFCVGDSNWFPDYLCSPEIGCVKKLGAEP